MFTNDASMFNEMYRRFIERQLREQIGFEGTPIRVLWRSKPTKKTVVSNWTKGGAPSYAGGTSGKAYAG
jgi:GTP-binding protein